MILRLVSSSETIILDNPSSSIWRVVSYVPQTPSVRSRSIANIGSDGESVADVEYENVSEPCTITLTEASQSAALTVVQAINRMFERARTRGDVYLERSDDGSTFWRSKIFYGRAELDPDTYRPWQLPQGKLDISLEWEREYCWEGPEAQATLRTAAGASVSSVTLYGRDDGTSGQVHWFVVPAAQIGGDLPARVRLRVMNSYDNSAALGKLTIARSALADTNDHRLVLEGESATGTGSTPSDSGVSGGAVRRHTLSEFLSTHATWTLSSSLLGALAGRYYKILLRTAGSIPPNTWARVRVSIGGVTPLVITPPVRLINDQVQEIAAVPLPPIAFTGTAQQLTLELQLRGSGTLDNDCIFILPTESYRILRRGNVPYGSYVIDDNGQAYSSPDGTVKLPNYVGDGPPLTLTPAVDNTLYILAESAVGGNSEILRTIQASVFVTPRKLSL